MCVCMGEGGGGFLGVKTSMHFGDSSNFKVLRACLQMNCILILTSNPPTPYPRFFLEIMDPPLLISTKYDQKSEVVEALFTVLLCPSSPSPK